ncbi:MAG: GFA family protein [Granulosicoccus sp.]
MPVTEKVVKGGCLCGRIHYEITGPLFGADHCHCSMCRRQHGAAFSTYAAFNPGDFNWISGEGQIKVYETLAGAGWCFCSECGSSLAGTENGRVTTVALGAIEGCPDIRPESHIFVGSKAQWYAINDDLPQFKERPPVTWNSPSKTPDKI